MSKSLDLRHIALLLTVVCVCAAARSTPADAQTAAQVQARIDTMRDSLRLTQRELDVARSRRILVVNDSLVSEGVTVRFPASAVAERDRVAIREGISSAREALDARFGAGAARLVEGSEWLLGFQGLQEGRTAKVGFVEGRVLAGRYDRFARTPLSASEVEDYVLELAGRQLLQRDLVVKAFANGAFSLVPQDRAFYVAQRQLAISPSSVARRCAAGAASACRTILDQNAQAQWFAPTDTIPRNGRAIARGVNASLVTVAMEIGGEGAIDRLAEPDSSADAIVILAHAAGVTPDSLLHAWTARLQEESTQSAHPSMPFALSAVFWCGIFLLAATRRRPQ